MRFKHSGKLGDVIYALPAIKACGNSALYLDLAREFQGDASVVMKILPLLNAQPYISHAGIWRNEHFNIDLDQFRTCAGIGGNLADAHLQVMGLSSSWRNDRWISITKVDRRARVICARSLAHRGLPGFWERCLELCGKEAVFVGSAAEHRSFCSQVSEIEFIPTRDLLALAELLAGCCLFIGNQSCPFAIAEGLKVPVIQETFQVANCIFERADALHARTNHDLDLIAPFISEVLQGGKAVASV